LLDEAAFGGADGAIFLYEIMQNIGVKVLFAGGAIGEGGGVETVFEVVGGAAEGLYGLELVPGGVGIVVRHMVGHISID